MRKNQLLGVLLLVAVSCAGLAATPATAFAQRRLVLRGPRVRPTIFFRGYYPGFFAFDPWLQYPYGPYPPYGPYGPYGPYPPPYYAFRDETSAIRLDVKPRQTEVYVDGYRAGVVDHFAGFFQRLRVRPGEHDLVLYLDGYRTVHEHLLLGPGSDQKIKYTMVGLAPGETAEPRPEPPPPPPPPSSVAPVPPPGPRGAPAAGGAPEPRMMVQESSFGTLSIRVQPANADVLIDGERWAGPDGQARLLVQLTEGKHKIEVRKDGYQTYTSELEIRRGETNTLNVSLLHSDGHGS